MSEGFDKRLDDHETRIRGLEESNYKQEIQLKNIEVGQMRIENKLMEQGTKTGESLEKITTSLVSMLVDDNSTKNKIKLTDRKEFWGAVAIILGIAITVANFFFI